MDRAELSDREQLILQAVVHTYITTAEAVGSRVIVRRYGLDLSPASVRNVMSDLEEAGYLKQLHTSSGRVPTDRGYRYYVDYLMRVQELTLAERERIEREFEKKLTDAEQVMRQTSQLLALVSHQTGIVEAPPAGEAFVRHIELLPVSTDRVAALIADSFGRVRTVLVAPDGGVQSEELQRLSRFLNDTFVGVAVDRLASSIQGTLGGLVDEQRRMAERALEVLELLPPYGRGQLFLEGATQLFEQPEFRDVDRAREVFSLLDEQDRLIELLRSGLAEDGTQRPAVLFGSEAHGPGLDGISVVTSPYYVDDTPVGVVGVLGPRRMPYSKLTAVVGYTADLFSRFLTRLAG